MIRDKYKAKSYFDDFVESLNESQQRRFEKLKANKIKANRIFSVKRDMCKNFHKLIIAKYSRGDNMFSNDVYSDLYNSIELLNESWYKNHLGIIPSKKSRDSFLSQYSLSSYMLLIDLLSLSILLNVSLNSCTPIIKFIDKDNVEDFLFEFLISHYDKSRKEIKEESYKEYFGINERLGRLKTIIKETDNTIAEKELKYFLENEWYPSFKDTPLYNQHLNPHNTYVGYWCFVAAAIVKIKGLDDSSFKDNEYYPKDMLNN